MKRFLSDRYSLSIANMSIIEACLKVLVIIVFFSDGYNCLKVVDLSWDFGNETVYWPRPGGKRFEFTKVVAHEDRGYWYSRNEFCAPEHGGTHFDAPYHFDKNGWKVGDVPVERLVAKASGKYAVNEFCAGEHGGTHFDAPYHFSKHAWKVGDVPVERLIAKGATIDLSKKATKELLVEHLDEWRSVNGDFENNTVLLIRFGWSQYYHNITKYFGFDSSSSGSRMDFPGISEGAARWIAAQSGIVGVGLDTPSVDPGISIGFETHRIFGANQIYGLENVKLLTELPAKGYTLVVLPMKIKYGTGAPLRIVALLDEDD